jgi:hypothetical protein
MSGAPGSRRRFLLGGLATSTAIVLGAGATSTGCRAPTTDQDDAGPADALAFPAPDHPQRDRVREVIRATIGLDPEPTMLTSFLDHLDKHVNWLWADGVDVAVADRVICTRFIEASSLLVNGFDLDNLEFYGTEPTCNPLARFN